MSDTVSSVTPFPFATTSDNRGYSWRFLSFPLDNGKYRVYVSDPEERRLAALQNIPASLFSHVGFRSRYGDIGPDDQLFKRLYFLREPDNEWTNKVYVPPEILYAQENVNLSIKYLRRIVSGFDRDKTIYTLPTIAEMEKVVMTSPVNI
jgi:hypothetical protein